MRIEINDIMNRTWRKGIRILCMTAILALSGCGQSTSSTPSAAQTAGETTAAATEMQETEAVTEAQETEVQETEAAAEAETEPAIVIPDTPYVSPKNTGKLKVENGTLCAEDGTPVQLKGVSTHSLCRTEPFLNQDLFYEFRTEWGVNVIRLAMYVAEMDGYTKSEYFQGKNVELVQKGVELATANDLYVLIDWHVLKDQNPLNNVEAAIGFFDQMSLDYKDYNNVIYEICNEPNDTTWEDIKAYANQVIPVIRANDPDAVVICGTPDWSQGVDQALADPLEFDNVMYTLHFYSATHKDELRDRMVECSQAGLPIFVTEYGVTASNGGMPRDLEEADRWMEAMDENNISSCIWNLAKNGEPCCLFLSQSKVYHGFPEEDLTETGIWFRDMMADYRERIESGAGN